MLMYLFQIQTEVDHDVARDSHTSSDHTPVITVNVQMEISAPVQRQSHSTSLSDVTQWGSHIGLGL